ncbi:UNVERIFIED_CONTAM: hypothetical protein Slati_3864600 [Sesamum latifolium]|uniref:Uncharacterized protein n=1 Tax=Sesamum latifolium TaxID=2727402 RepID=A0AAW2TLL3_9LAMI
MGSSKACLLAILLLLQLIYEVDGIVMFEVHHRYGGRGKEEATLKALRAHDLRAHGRMLADIDFQAAGDVIPNGDA